MSFRVSVDTGGTFTDVVVADKTGRLHIGKAATTPERSTPVFPHRLTNRRRSEDSQYHC